MTLNQFTQVPAARAKCLGKLGPFQEGTFLTPGTATAHLLRILLKIFIFTVPQTFHFLVEPHSEKYLKEQPFPLTCPGKLRIFQNSATHFSQPC